MRMLKVHVLPILITVLTLLAAGYAQTSNARPGQETSNSQDASQKPSNSGGDTATGTPPDSANSPRPQAAPGMQNPPSPVQQRATPANPAAADQNSPTATAAPESQAAIPQNVLFELFFRHIANLNEIADHDDKVGEHIWAARWRTHDQRGVGLNDAEDQILQETTMDCLRALKEQNAKFRVAAEKFRAQLKPGAPIQIPPELVQMGEDRKKIVSDHIESLREALGDASFNKLDAYVHSTFHAEVIAPKPVAPSTPIIEKSHKESRWSRDYSLSRLADCSEAQ